MRELHLGALAFAVVAEGATVAAADRVDSSGHASGTWRHIPARSSTLHSSVGSSQYSPVGQAMPAMVPQTAAHGPRCAMLIPRFAASHSFEYVRPSQPQTGTDDLRTLLGTRAASAHAVTRPTGFWQNCARRPELVVGAEPWTDVERHHSAVLDAALVLAQPVVAAVRTEQRALSGERPRRPAVAGAMALGRRAGSIGRLLHPSRTPQAIAAVGEAVAAAHGLVGFEAKVRHSDARPAVEVGRAGAHRQLAELPGGTGIGDIAGFGRGRRLRGRGRRGSRLFPTGATMGERDAGFVGFALVRVGLPVTATDRFEDGGTVLGTQGAGSQSVAMSDGLAAE